ICRPFRARRGRVLTFYNGLRPLLRICRPFRARPANQFLLLTTGFTRCYEYVALSGLGRERVLLLTTGFTRCFEYVALSGLGPRTSSYFLQRASPVVMNMSPFQGSVGNQFLLLTTGFTRCYEYVALSGLGEE